MSLSRVPHFAFGALAALTGALAVGCATGDAGAPGIQDGPGNRILSDIIACKADTDCESGESCGQGFCQMRRCSDKGYTSLPPFGSTGYAYTDRAFVVSAAGTAIDVYSNYEKGGSSVAADAAPLDIAGGNLTGARPEGIAFVRQGSRELVVVANGQSTRIDVGFQGMRVATGDTDGDGIDEVVVSGAGKYAVCSAVTKTCTPGTITGTPDDVALGDVNGDGVDEIIFAGASTLTIVDSVAKKTTSHAVSVKLTHITAGDLDGDGKAEVVGTEVGGIAWEDKIHVFGMLGDALAAQTQLAIGYTTFNNALDLAITRQDDKALLGVLTDGSTLKTYAYANGALRETSSKPVRRAGALHIAAADVNGRSATVKQKGEPTVTAGPVVPLAVLTAPPYSAAYSADRSGATLGTDKSSSTGEGSGQGNSTTVVLTVGAGVGFKIWDAIGVNANANLTNVWSRNIARSKGRDASRSVGGSYTVAARPDIDGYHSGGVVLAGACFHRYEYTVDDPAKVLGGKGEALETFVPVGGETTLWSTNRYNALVEMVADGRLPKITIAAKLGSVESYPSEPSTLDGKPIPPADMLFKSTPLIRVSDVGNVGFSLTMGQSESNTTASSFSFAKAVNVGGGVGFKLFGVDANVNANRTDEQGMALDSSYTVSTGSSTTFSGGVQPVRDNPVTPGNEATLHGYSFKPHVYRQRYTSKDGQEGAFYALTYTVGE